jgi:hypothetical protein
MKPELGERYYRSDGLVTGPLEATGEGFFRDVVNGTLYTGLGEAIGGSYYLSAEMPSHREPDPSSPSDPRRYEIALRCLPALIIAGAEAGISVQPSRAVEEALSYADLLLEKMEERE